MTQPSRFVRAMSAVADFSHLFYAEERQREIWNEAQTVGMQLTLWLGLVLANVMVWAGGREVASYAIALVALLVAASVAIITYAKQRAVVPGSSVALHPVRLVAYLVLYLGFVLGAVLNLVAPTIEGPTVVGMMIGAVTGSVALVIGLRRQRRRVADDPDADVFDDETGD